VPKLLEGRVVRDMITLRGNDLMQILADHFGVGVAEDTFGGWIPVGYPTFRVYHQDSVLGRVGYRTHAGFALPQRRLGLFAHQCHADA
jgi:hypothetical protein